MRHSIMRLLLACALLAGCSNDDENPSTDTQQPMGGAGGEAGAGGAAPDEGTGGSAATDKKVTRIVLSSASQLLNGVGTTAQLEATAYNADGDKLPDAVVTWRSKNAKVVSVNADGELTGKLIGSTEVFAEVGDVSSPPAIAWVAKLPKGALLFDDEQLVSGPTRVGAAGPMVLGTRFTVVLSDIAVPKVGTIVLAEQEAPVAGKVVKATEGDEGVTLTLEVVGLPELFIDLDFELHDTSRPAPTAAALGKFQLAGFECESDTEADIIPEVELSASFANSERFSMVRGSHIEIRDGVPKSVSIKITGSVQLDMDGSLTFPLDMEGSVVCKQKVGNTPTFEVPVGGLGFVLTGEVPMGFGFELKGSFESTALVARSQGFLRADVAFGFEYTEDTGFQVLNSLVPSHGLQVTWDPPLLQDGGTIKASAFPFFYAEVNTGESDLDLFAELRAGIESVLDLSPPDLQTIDPTLASAYRAASHGKFSAGTLLREILARFGIRFVENVTFDSPPDSDVLQSPVGTTTASTNEIVAGETVTIRAELDPETVVYDDDYNVASIHVWRKDDAEDWHEVEELEAEDGQTVFEYEWTPTEAEEQGGTVEYAVTVETVKMPDVQLEIAPDSRQSIGSGDGPPATLVGTYEQISHVQEAPGSTIPYQTFPSCPGGDRWLITPEGVVWWYDATNTCTAISQVLPFQPVVFSGTAFTWSNPATRMERCYPSEEYVTLASTLTLTGTATVAQDGSVELLVRFRRDWEHCEGLSVSWEDFVLRKPAPTP